MTNFEIRDDEHGIGKVLILKEAWSNEISDFMIKENIRALRLSDSAGFKYKNLSFIPSLSFLRSLELYCWEAKDIKMLEELPQLEVLSMQSQSSKKIDFSSFKNLRVVMLTWAKGLTSILESHNIEHLNIQNYPYKSLEPIEHMLNLKKLYITSRKLETLHGIEKLKNLELLDLYNCQKLISKEGINKCVKLNNIEIEACNKLSA